MAARDDECFPGQRDELTIAPMRSGDLDRVVEIERQSFPTTWHRESYERELRNPSAHYVVAKLGGQVAGFAGMWAIMDEAHVTTIAVASECRRRGIGERLLVALIEEADRRGAKVVTLEVREGNEPARALYDKYGFEAVAYLPGYYPDTGEVAVVMWLKPLRLLAQPRRDSEPRGGSR